MHPHDREATIEQVARLREGLDVIQFRNRYRDHWSDYRWFEWTSGLATGGGESSRSRAMSRSNGHRDAINAAGSHERTILDHLQHIHVRDRNGCIEFCNRRFAEAVKGTPLDEGTPSNRVLSPQERQSFEEVLRSKVMVTQDEVLRYGPVVRNFVTSRIPLIGTDGGHGCRVSLD